MKPKQCPTCGNKTPPTQHEMEMLREEERLLTAFKGNSELIECMGFLDEYYSPTSALQLQKPQTVPSILSALCKADSESRRFAQHALDYKFRTEQRIDDLIAVVNFLREACSRNHQGVSVTATHRTIDLADIFATIDDYLQEMKDAHCPLTYVDHMEHILKRRETDTK